MKGCMYSVWFGTGKIIYRPFPLRDLDIAGQLNRYNIPDLYDLYDLGHVVGWELYNLLHLLLQDTLPGLDLHHTKSFTT